MFCMTIFPSGTKLLVYPGPGVHYLLLARLDLHVVQGIFTCVLMSCSLQDWGGFCTHLLCRTEDATGNLARRTTVCDSTIFYFLDCNKEREIMTVDILQSNSDTTVI